MIDHVSLDHGWYYFYRIHKGRLNKLPSEYSDLQQYLFSMLDDCPDEKFQDGPRSSKLKLDLGIEPEEVDNHPVTSFAREGLEWDNYNTAHSNVQVYMLHNDPQTLCVEAPIWVEPDEASYHNLFEESNPLSGHIDLIRFEGDKIWIWDYKPNAHREKYATTQTYFYAQMLSQRTGIPLDKFMCGYFDTDTTFIYKPEHKYLSEEYKC